MNEDDIDALTGPMKQANAREGVAAGPTNIGKSGTNDHARTRRDKGRTHVTRYGLLSRDVVRALVRTGESLRNIRRYEKQFRSVFKPRGPLAEHFFDRWWSCHLRLILLGKLEADALTSDHTHRHPLIRTELREGSLPTLVSISGESDFESSGNLDFQFSRDLLSQLALAQRYDSHYAREANRMLAVLLLMRKGGKAALEKLICDGLDFTRIQNLGK